MTLTQRANRHTTWLTIIATVSQPLLPVLLLDLHIYPISEFCFLTSMSTGGRHRHVTRLWSGREDSTTKIFAPRQWWPSFFSSSASRHENFSKRRRFLELLNANGRSTAMLSHPGLSRAGSGSRKKNSGSRTEGCDDVVTRLDPIATHLAGGI